MRNQHSKMCIQSCKTYETKKPFSSRSLLYSSPHLDKSLNPCCRLLLLLILLAILSSFAINPCHATCKKLERDSLLAFSLNVSSSPIPLNWSSSVDCCMWEGVGCDNRDRVTHLWLPSRGLVGSISPSIANLTHLSQLSLSWNSLFGYLPDGFFTSLNRLEIVDLSCNVLYGKFQASDKLPTTIQMVNLSSNYFHGTIQSSFLELASNVQRFDVSSNSFSGSIPSSVCRFSPLIQYLDFSDNGFVGPIPQGFGQCSHLQNLRAGYNNLSGAIPNDIYTVLTLQELYLPANGLSSPIHGSIINLINLRTLALYGNELTGKIPQDIGRLYNLERLELHINNLNGTLPPSLTNCTRLTMLNLRVNLLEGELSAFDFSKFIQLRSIDLGDNFFSGKLPATLFLCKNLTAIRLATNRLNGEVLPDIMALQSLSFLSLSNNTLNNITSAMRILTGCKTLSTLILSKNFYNEPLPGDVNLIRDDEFKNLHVLVLRSCGFTGQIPMWLSRLDKLEVLDLSFNKITGSIPGWFGNLPNLFYLDLSENLLSGYFTMEIMKLRRLATSQISDLVDRSYLEFAVFDSTVPHIQRSYLPPAIYLRSNSISGAIPVEIGQLKFIRALDLSSNNFSGRIPDTLSNLTRLEVLDLSSNNFSGRIPDTISHLTNLEVLDLSSNHLEGPIPVGGQIDTFPNSSFEGNPGLCGWPLERLCVYKQTTEIRKGPKKEFINLKIFGISFGISIVLAVLADFKLFSLILRMVWPRQSVERVGEESIDAPVPSISPVWRAPNVGELKLNTDAVVRFGEHYIGTGAVIRDQEGVVVAACSRHMVGEFQPEEAKAVALREGLLFAKNNGFKIAVAECDALRVIKCLHSDFNLSSYSVLLYDIVALLKEVNCCTCRFIPQVGNQVARRLASSAISIPVVFDWLDCIPIFISQSVLGDGDINFCLLEK